MTDGAGSAGTKVAELNVLGGFVLRARGDVVTLSPHLQRLVALLALSGTPLVRRYVVGVLWGDSSEAHAHGSLRSALWKLRVGGLPLIENHGDSLALSPAVEVDVRKVTRLAGRLIGGQYEHEADELLDPTLLLELLPGWYEDWVLVERERLRQLSLHALELLCDELSAASRFGPAVLAGLAAVNREPLRESSYRALMRAHLAEGNAGEALRSYRQYADLAARELGIEPSGLMRTLLPGLLAAPVDGDGHLAMVGSRT